MPPERAAKKRQKLDPQEDDPKRQRGRPRVDGQDETAADRRRTQIRLAQRAYRQRKETTISNLKSQVSNLRATIQEMESIFLDYNDKAMASGLLHKSPHLATELRSATESFLQLAKRTEAEEEEQSDCEHDESPRKTSATFAKDVNQALGNDRHTLSPSPESQGQKGQSRYVSLGYSQIFEDTPPPSAPKSRAEIFDSTVYVTGHSLIGTSVDMSLIYPSETHNTNPLAITSPPKSGASRREFTVLNQPRLQPQPTSTLALPYTYSFEETTFARRLQRATVERGYHLLSTAQMRPATFIRVFRLSLLYSTREMLLEKFHRALLRTSEEPIETYQTPFIHLGGAGMHYNTGRVRNGYIVKPGPLQSQATLVSTETSGAMYDIELDLKEYEGEWFDANDVEGYLLEKGLTINPRSTFVEGSIVLPQSVAVSDSLFPPGSHASASHVFDSPSPSNAEQDVTMHTPTDNGPESRKEPACATRAPGAPGILPELGSGLSPDTNWNITATNWLLGSGDKTPDFVNSGWGAKYTGPSDWDPKDTVGFPDSAPYSTSGMGTSYDDSSSIPAIAPPNEKRHVAIDQSVLINELLKNGICLGRAPGFRKKDVDRALSAAIVQVF